MTRFLLLISILFASMANLFASASEQELIPPDTLFRFENSERVEYNFSLQFKNNTFTGVCVMKLMGQEIRGSIMNEFGVKAFDFVYDTNSRSIDLRNVIGFMNRLLVKRTLKADWKYLLSFSTITKADKKRSIVVTERGEIIFKNKKRGIVYKLSPLNITDCNNDIAE